MSSYDIPDMIPAGLMSSSSLKGAHVHDQHRNIASTSLQLSRGSETEPPHGSSYLSYTGPERDASHRLSRDNHETSQLPANRQKHKNKSTEPAHLRQKYSRTSPSNDSASHSDSDSKSGSSDSDEEARIDAEMLLRNPLKSQGQIHDMLLKATAQTAKAIQKTGRNLERTMRTMADVTFAKYYNSHSSSETQETLPKQPKRQNTVSEELPQNRSTEEPPHKKLKEHSDAEPPNVKIDNVRLASSDTLDVLYQIDQKKATTKYDRKPRSLLYNIAPASSSHLNKLLVSTTMNGDIHMWNCDTRKIMTTVHKKDLQIDSWAEDICWATPETLAVAINQRDKHSEGRQLCLVNIKDNDQYQSSVQTFDQKPHFKGISAIAHVGHSEGSDGKVSSTFVTGGDDHQLMLWELTRTDRKTNFQASGISPLRSKHTSHVHAIHYDEKAHKVYSGGADRKLAWVNLDATTTATGEVKFEDRINHILANEVNPHLLMICLAGVKDQMRLYDVRMQHTSATVLSFGCSEPENVSRYIRPDWKPNSWTVAGGNMSDHKIYIWDVRYKRITSGGPSYSWNGHGKFACNYVERKYSEFVASDRTTLFTDFQLQSDGRVTARD
ncbi:hypothetical protein INT43_006606 [Umbelopsis isabellina]|uniref:WD40 repeat-like protein n=1 Tax=Mortierella isabellina TaxID=91625 RepID=A0A8H7Q1I4_MORIS|nr:hypothetical protein INT43_006606 [Umbelopsis isabellina]